MQDRKKRLGWAVLAVLLPGPWTPVLVLAYALDRTRRDHPPAEASSTRDPDAPPS